MYFILGVAFTIFLILLIGKNAKPKIKSTIEDKVESYIPHEDEDKIIIPEGWQLVRRKSENWNKLGFTEGENFPGYGKVYHRTFDVWYKKVGEKEITICKEFSDRGVLHYSSRLCGIFEPFENKQISLAPLQNKKDYIFLMTGVDNSTRIRWYFGLKKIEPTYIYTQPKEL